MGNELWEHNNPGKGKVFRCQLEMLGGRKQQKKKQEISGRVAEKFVSVRKCNSSLETPYWGIKVNLFQNYPVTLEVH